MHLWWYPVLPITRGCFVSTFWHGTVMVCNVPFPPVTAWMMACPPQPIRTLSENRVIIMLYTQPYALLSMG